MSPAEIIELAKVATPLVEGLVNLIVSHHKDKPPAIQKKMATSAAIAVLAHTEDKGDGQPLGTFAANQIVNQLVPVVIHPLVDKLNAASPIHVEVGDGLKFGDKLGS